MRRGNRGDGPSAARVPARLSRAVRALSWLARTGGLGAFLWRPKPLRAAGKRFAEVSALAHLRRVTKKGKMVTAQVGARPPPAADAVTFHALGRTAEPARLSAGIGISRARPYGGGPACFFVAGLRGAGRAGERKGGAGPARTGAREAFSHRAGFAAAARRVGQGGFPAQGWRGLTGRAVSMAVCLRGLFPRRAGFAAVAVWIWASGQKRSFPAPSRPCRGHPFPRADDSALFRSGAALSDSRSFPFPFAPTPQRGQARVTPPGPRA